LRLLIYYEHWTVPGIFGLLRETSFPKLRRLHVLFPGPEAVFIVQGRQVRFDPLVAYSGSVLFRQLRDWTMDAPAAERLESVLVEMRSITEFCHANAFLELFGSANRPGVMRVCAGGAALPECSSSCICQARARPEAPQGVRAQRRGW
jgi:hypothetical protein